MRVLWRFKSELCLTLVALILFVGAGGTRPVDDGCGTHLSTTTVHQMQQIMTVLEDFRRVCGFYPTTEQGLEALIHAPKGRECKNYPKGEGVLSIREGTPSISIQEEGFLTGGKVPYDAWDVAFQYESDGSNYRISSTHGYALTNGSSQVSYSEGKPPGDEVESFGPRPGYHILVAYVLFMIFVTRKRWRPSLPSEVATVVSVISFLVGFFALLGSCSFSKC